MDHGTCVITFQRKRRTGLRRLAARLGLFFIGLVDPKLEITRSEPKKAEVVVAPEVAALAAKIEAEHAAFVMKEAKQWWDDVVAWVDKGSLHRWSVLRGDVEMTRFCIVMDHMLPSVDKLQRMIFAYQIAKQIEKEHPGIETRTTWDDKIKNPEVVIYVPTSTVDPADRAILPLDS